MRPLWRIAPVAWLALCAGCATPPRAPAPIPIKVVVVTMFEIGADSGDAAGEFQLWHERQKLDTQLPFAHHHDQVNRLATEILNG